MFSQYAKVFEQPVIKHNLQADLDEAEAIRLSHVPIRAALNDATSSIFHDERLRKFTNYVMKGGRRQLARELVERGFENIKRTQLERYNLAESPEEKAAIETDPMKIFHVAVENCRPVLTLTPIKRGGVRYQVPVPVTEKRSYFMAMKWLLEAINEKERTVHFPQKFAWEMLDAFASQGRVIKKKLELHKQCEANRAYAHYRWS